MSAEHDDTTHEDVPAGGLVPRADVESIDPVQERRALARLQSKLFGKADAALKVGRYELGRRIGSGGMGIVYEAEDPSLHRRIAIKLVRSRSSEALQNTIVEARALAAISEPNVVTVFDAGLVDLDDGETTAFIAMELLEGPTLAAWLDGTHGWREVLRKFAAAGRGLAAAHRRGVVHGDFKPGNVLFGRGGRPLVCDFGLARVLDDALMHTEDLVDAGAPVVRGTPGYIAPEMIAGDPPTARSDQFAFSVALHRALRSAALGEPLGGAPLIASALPPLPKEIPTAIDAAVRRGFDPDPERRFASMEELLAALRHATRTRWYRRPAPWVLAVAVVAWVAVPRGSDPCPDAVAAQERLRERVLALPELQPASDAKLASDRLQQRVDAVDRLAVDACRSDDHAAKQRALRCLARRRKELDHLAQRTEDNPAAHAVLAALETMGDPSECAASSGPGSEAETDTAEEIDAIEDLLSASSVAESMGDYADAERLAEDALARAVALDSPPALARAHLRLADTLYKRGSWDAALASAETAYETALDVQLYDVAVLAATRAMVAVHEPGEIEWQRWQRHAETALQHTPSIRPRVLLASRLSIILEREARYPEALEQAERAIEGTRALAQDGVGDPHLEILARQMRGIALWRLGRLDEAELVLREALADREELVGVRSPNLAPLRHELAVVLRAKGRHAEALPLVELNYEVERIALPPGHPDIIGSLIELAAVKRALGRFEEAAVDLAKAEKEVHPGTSGFVRAALWIAQANVLTETEQWAEAESKLTSARTVLEGEGESGWHPRVTVLLNLTELHRVRADRERALQELGAALEVLCPHISAERCEQAKAEVEAARSSQDLARIGEAVIRVRALGPSP